jgi:hypothetical protein
MIINKDNNGKPIGFIETLISNEHVITINATRQAETVTTRDRKNGKVKTEIFFETLPLIPKDQPRPSGYAASLGIRIVKNTSAKWMQWNWPIKIGMKSWRRRMRGTQRKAIALRRVQPQPGSY